MAKFTISWQETHITETEAEDEETAEEIAMKKDPNETIVNIQGLTITKKEETKCTNKHT